MPEKSDSFLLNIIYMVRKSRLMKIGVFLTLLMILLALFAPLIATHDPYRTNVRNRLQGPSRENWMGTDENGRDIFSRAIYGGRVSAIIGFNSVFFSTFFGILFGLLAGYFPKLDNVMMRVMDAMMAFKPIILAIAIMAALGPSMRNVVIALTINYTPRTARIVRGEALSIREETYVKAAISMGASGWRIIFKHILPNIVSPIIVQATYIMALAIFAEAALSYVGAGTPPPTPSWGNILADGRAFMRQAPWMTIFPGLFIMLSILGINIMGDVLRDFFDPKTNIYEQR